MDGDPEVAVYQERTRDGQNVPEAVDLPTLLGKTGKGGGGQSTFIHAQASHDAGESGDLAPPVGIPNPVVFNALQDDKGAEDRDYSPPVAGSEKNGGALAVAGTVRSHVRPGSNTSAEILELPDPDSVLRERLEAEGFLPAVPFDPQPDGPRYAAMGDAVTVNVIEWIGVRLARAIEVYDLDLSGSKATVPA